MVAHVFLQRVIVSTPDFCASFRSGNVLPERNAKLFPFLCDHFGSLLGSGKNAKPMKLPRQNRYNYVPIYKRPTYEWPNGTRLAVTVCTNIEHFAFRAGLGSDNVTANGPQRPQMNSLGNEHILISYVKSRFYAQRNALHALIMRPQASASTSRSTAYAIRI